MTRPCICSPRYVYHEVERFSATPSSAGRPSRCAASAANHDAASGRRRCLTRPAQQSPMRLSGAGCIFVWCAPLARLELQTRRLLPVCVREMSGPSFGRHAWICRQLPCHGHITADGFGRRALSVNGFCGP